MSSVERSFAGNMCVDRRGNAKLFTEKVEYVNLKFRSF